MQKTTESIQYVYNDAGAEEFNSLAETLLKILSDLLKTQDGRNEQLLGTGKLICLYQMSETQ